MKDILEFFDKFNEIVFISDVDTHDVLYMNQKLKDYLGYSTQEDCTGKKCYHILQGLDAPCPFCEDHVLTPEAVSSWIHKNAMLNKRFLINDTLIQYDNRLCRLEIALDIENHFNDNCFQYSQSERILNDCLQHGITGTDPEESIKKILSYIGNTFLCDHAYIFEFDDTLAHCTYEWHNGETADQTACHRVIPLSDIDQWLSVFQKKEMVIITDLEEIRTEYPQMYTRLKAKGITRLAAAPILMEEQEIGFLEVVNADAEMMPLVISLLNMIGYFITTLLKRRELLSHLRELSFYDSLTGAFNRNALFEHNEQFVELKSMGVIYCDVTGLKQVNDTLGHAEGDKMLRTCYDVLRDSLSTNRIYRVGGDEFVAVFGDLSEQEFSKQVTGLKSRIRETEYHIAVGHVWSAHPPFQIDFLISEADKNMYLDKQSYYETNNPVLQETKSTAVTLNNLTNDKQSRFIHFLEKTDYDTESFFQSVTYQNTACYFFLGDMQKNLFFVSDNMRDDFGFQDNEISDLPHVWKQKIATEQAKNAFWNSWLSMLQNKSDIHDMRYRVQLANKKTLWVHSYGILKWNEDKSAPLFFSGRITHQNDDFIVDSFTNFPREAAMLERINRMKRTKRLLRLVFLSTILRRSIVQKGVCMAIC